jgi:hypothetical protein
MKEYCNPIDIEYKFQHYGDAAHREAADPTLIFFNGKYYLFASMSAGFYFSDNLVDWKWHENRELGLYLYAPDVRQNGEYLYFCASDRQPSSIWRTKDPLGGRFEKVSTPFAFWDPNLFFDNDGKVYLFWGCGNTEPLYGVELDSETFLPLGKKTALIYSDIEHHGFERFNYPGKKPEKRKGSLLMRIFMYFMNRRGMPYMEGAFCNKWHGKYYLQYAAPATEYSVYADGVYVADKPLGPYHYQIHNPFSSKPSGFINGAGHGSTIEDEYGNLWHASTMSISVNASFERRIGIFPAGLDEDDILYCNQHFADYPYLIPDGKFDSRSLTPCYMLLSYKKSAIASSVLDGHGPELALNEDIRTWWCANGGAGEWFQVDLGKIYQVHSIQVNLAEENIPVLKVPKEQLSAIYTNNRYIDSGHGLRTRCLLEGSLDGNTWFVIRDASQDEDDRTHVYTVLEKNTDIRYVRITAIDLAYIQKFALSGVRIFGLDNSGKPAVVKTASITKLDQMTVTMNWEKAEGATGYNIRYGIERNKLYSSILVYGQTSAILTMLNSGNNYWYCIDSFNESGITEGEARLMKNNHD